VLPEIDDEPVAEVAPTTDPFGASNRVDFQQGYVRMDGSFTEAQLEAVLAGMKGKR
jgi:hypothetical protein